MLLDLRLAEAASFIRVLYFKLLTVNKHGFGSVNVQIFVDVSEFFEVVDVVFVGVHIKAQVFARQLIQLLQVDVVAKVVTLQSS